LSEVSDPEFRIVVIDETAEATVSAVAERAEALATMLRAEEAERSGLTAVADAAYERASLGLRSDISSGRYSALAAYQIWAQAAVDLAGAITRAAGVAAEETAATWLIRRGGPRLLDPGHEGLRRHGPEAAGMTRELLDAWKDDLDDIAAERRRRVRRRKKRRLVDELWRATLDPDLEPRRWAGDYAPLIDRARDLLGDVVEESLRADAERFRRRLGSRIDRDLPDRVIAAASYLRDLPDDVGADETPPSSDPNA
jgi:hypothetical protein